MLASVFSGLRLESLVAGAFDARGDYAVEIGQYAGVKLHLIIRGEFWLTIEGEKQAVHVREGDCVLLTNGQTAKIARTQSAKEVTPLEALQSKAVNGVMTLNGGGDFFGIGLHFLFSGHFPKVLFSHLPASILVPSHSEQAVVLR